MNGEPVPNPPGDLERLSEQLQNAIARLAAAKPFSKPLHSGRVTDVARRILKHPDGPAVIYARAAEMDQAGIFLDSDWDTPERLQPVLVHNTFEHSDDTTVLLECLNQLRMLAIAEGTFWHANVTDDMARHYLHQVLALNLDHIFGFVSEAQRKRPSTQQIVNVLQFIVERTGYEHILDTLIEEIWRLLRQRPIMVNEIKTMIVNVANCLSRENVNLGATGHGAQRLVSALFGPTVGCQEDPGLDAYRERLATYDEKTLAEEAAGFARAMHDTGLASVYHAAFLRFLLHSGNDRLIAAALGLSRTGHDVLFTFQELVHSLIEEAIFPATCQAIYGLASFLERGILFSPPVAPALWRQIYLPLTPQVTETLETVLGAAVPARVHLLAGVLNVLGLPLGIGQGNNPTCQSARALSVWAYNNPDYLLQLLTWAARDGDIAMTFEGQELSSAAITSGVALAYHLDLDPVSIVLVPHLDRLYAEMGRLCIGRTQDSHKWINPEFHGRWVGRGFAIAVDITTGKLKNYARFIKNFYASYHPLYNGNKPVIYPQPAGIAVTDSHARFVGWHAITLMRVALDQSGVMRAYFYNPNNDSGQDWGNGVVISTSGRGENYGESSLPFHQFVSRLYLFHYDKLEKASPQLVPDEDVDTVMELGTGSWAADRLPDE